MTSGKTTLIARIGYPTERFRSPMIYNRWFEQKSIDAVVVPMGVKAEDDEQGFESSSVSPTCAGYRSRSRAR